MASQRVVVIGAGPAGVRATEALVAAGVRPVVIDESARDGGQIYRRQPQGFSRSYEQLYGTEASRAQSLHRTFEQLKSRIDYRPSTLAWSISARRLQIIQEGNAEALEFDRLIICSGATDRLFPVKGWHRAGCFSLGAAQIALKSQACAIGSRVVFLGTGPLLYLVAAQYLKAGARVEAVLDTSTARQRLAALPQLAARPAVLLKGIALTAFLKRAGAKIETGITPIEVTGEQQRGVDGLRVRTQKGTEKLFECDAVALGYHLRAETQLADLARCEFRFDTESRQWLPQVDQAGRSSVPGIYLAGDGARILGADGAEVAGRLAALAALTDAGIYGFEHEMTDLQRELERMDRFRRGLLKAFPWPHRLTTTLQDEAIVCRCEAITAGELRRAVGPLGAEELNRAKAFSRIGMGRCQGRYCAHAAAEIVSETAHIPVEQVGRLRGQAPVKPLAICAQQTCEPST